jgi:hypothetical protein
MYEATSAAWAARHLPLCAVALSKNNPSGLFAIFRFRTTY